MILRNGRGRYFRSSLFFLENLIAIQIEEEDEGEVEKEEEEKNNIFVSSSKNILTENSIAVCRARHSTNGCFQMIENTSEILELHKTKIWEVEEKNEQKNSKEEKKNWNVMMIMGRTPISDTPHTTATTTKTTTTTTQPTL